MCLDSWDFLIEEKSTTTSEGEVGRYGSANVHVTRHLHLRCSPAALPCPGTGTGRESQSISCREQHNYRIISTESASMSSGFVSGGTADAPIERSDEWIAAQKEIEANRQRKSDQARQQDGRSLFETLEANKGIPTSALAHKHARTLRLIT